MDSARPNHQTSSVMKTNQNNTTTTKMTMLQECIQAVGGWKLRDSTTYLTEEELKSKPHYEMNRCFYNAIINKNYHYAGKNLRVVFGGFRIGTRFVYGGSDPMLLPRPSVDGGLNVHAWLEDDKGRIYDCLYSELVNQVPKANRKGMKAGVMEGRTRDELKDMNCFYIGYSEMVQLLWVAATFGNMFTQSLTPLDMKDANVQERFVNEMVDAITTSKKKASKFRTDYGQANLNTVRKNLAILCAQ